MANLNVIYEDLHKAYDSQGWWPISGKYSGKTKLNEKEKFEVCLGAILTQNTSWNNVERALQNLRKNKLLDKDKLDSVNLSKLALLIKSSGYNNQKAKKIKEFIGFLNSKPEINRENLLDIWGVGKETADSILLYAYNKPYFVVDSYTKRIFSRLGFCDDDATYDDLQRFFHENLEKDFKLFNEYHALIVEHAKKHCRTEPLCKECPINKHCNFFKKNYERLINE